jgi:DnaJ-class molecular chaperone
VTAAASPETFSCHAPGSHEYAAELDGLFDCDSCGGEGGYETGDTNGVGYRLSGHIGTQYHDCPDCDGGERELAHCHNCGAELDREDVALITVRHPRHWAFASCAQCAPGEV